MFDYILVYAGLCFIQGSLWTGFICIVTTLDHTPSQ